MKTLYLAPSFHRALKKLDEQQREKIADAVIRFREFLQSGQPRPGLGFKKLAEDVFEFRVDIHVRVVGIAEGNAYYLYAVGSHDDVRRFLRAHR